MSNTFDPLANVPQAVATIVAAFGHTIAGGEGLGPQDKEKRIVEFTDKLTRTLAQALLDKSMGK